MAKLMTPLFIAGNFNREGKRIRAEHYADYSNGDISYSVWKTESLKNSFPVDDTDVYWLMVLLDGYLIPLNMTEKHIRNRYGFRHMVKQQYGSEENRERFYKEIRQKFEDPFCKECNSEINTALQKDAEIEKLLSSGDCAMVDFISDFLSHAAKSFEDCERDPANNYPDFIGAVVCGKLDKCKKLAEVYYSEKKKRMIERNKEAKMELEAEIRRTNQQAAQEVSEAERIIMNGGCVQNKTIEFFDGETRKDTKLIPYLMKKHHLNVPIRTFGWMGEKLNSASFSEGKCVRLNYMKTKNGKCSDSVWKCLAALAAAVNT